MDTNAFDSEDNPIFMKNERPFNGGRFFLECWFYFAILATNFQNLTPLGSIQYGLGALTALTGGIFFLALLISRKSLPFSIWIAILLNIPVNLTLYYHGDAPILAPAAAMYWQYICLLAMFCYLVENEAAARRIALFVAVVVIGTVSVGSYDFNSEERIFLEQGVGQSFRNANDIAHIAALFAIACLFWSLKAKPYFRPVFWVAALLLFGVLLQTVSRGGLLAFGCGLIMLVVLVVSGKGQRLTGVILIVFCIIAASLFSVYLLRYYYLYSDRAALDTHRGSVYSLATLGEMKENLILGGGFGTHLRGAGIEPHNTFISTFIFYGGIAALLYLIWLFVLAVRLWRVFFYRELPVHLRFFLVALFGMALISQVLSNQGELLLSSVYATAMLEKYISLYSRRHLQQRNQSWQGDLDQYDSSIVQQQDLTEG